jgi:membrane protease YdiL (CAAX protease family)
MWWRVLLFVLLVAVFFAACARLMPRTLVRALVAEGQMGPGFIVVNELLVLVPVMAATSVMTWLEAGPFISCGLGGERRLVRLVQGAGCGLLIMGLLVLLLAAAGHGSLAWGGLRAGGVISFGLAWAAASLLIGFNEELALRGYLLQALWRGIGFWPALVITSLVFGTLHISNQGEGAIGVATAVLGGAIMALGVRGTGALWWSIGLHGAWDYVENFLAGTPDSGETCLGTLLRFTPHGPEILSGGATGPEGSIFALVLLVPALALSWRAFARAPV